MAMTKFFQPPKLRIGDENTEHRQASWLELFYDLVFVVAVAQLAHHLKEHISLLGFLGFVVLFIPLWWSWIGTTFYSNRFDNDDMGHRLLVLLQMMTAAALAINIHHGLSDSSSGFAMSYALGRILLVIEYIRASVHIPNVRPLTSRYAIGFAIAAIFWLISAFIPAPWRFGLWGMGIVIDFITPFTARKVQLKLLPHASHLPERFGLFTIIVLGEAIVAVVNGVSEQKWDISTVIAAFFGLITAFSLWWIYFDNLGGTPIIKARTQGKVSAMNIWLFTHLPFVIGITAMGVGVEQVLISKTGVPLAGNLRWLLCGAVALCYLALSIFHKYGVIRYCKLRMKYRLATAVILIAIAFLGQSLPPVAIIALVAVVSVLQVFQDLYQQRPTTRLGDPAI